MQGRPGCTIASRPQSPGVAGGVCVDDCQEKGSSRGGGQSRSCRIPVTLAVPSQHLRTFRGTAIHSLEAQGRRGAPFGRRSSRPPSLSRRRVVTRRCLRRGRTRAVAPSCCVEAGRAMAAPTGRQSHARREGVRGRRALAGVGAGPGRGPQRRVLGGGRLHLGLFQAGFSDWQVGGSKGGVEVPR